MDPSIRRYMKSNMISIYIELDFAFNFGLNNDALAFCNYLLYFVYSS